MTDSLGDVILRLPAEKTPRAVDAGIATDGVTESPFGITAIDRMVGHAVEGGEKLPDGGTRTGTHVDDRHRPGQSAEARKRGYMRRGQVPDMDIVPDA